MDSSLITLKVSGRMEEFLDESFIALTIENPKL